MIQRILFLALVLTSSFALTQVDTKAKAILDKVSAEMNVLKSMTIAFTMTITADGQDPIKQSGTFHIKGDKYKIELVDQDIYCDGTTITTHLKEEKEAYQSLVADQKGDDNVQPNQMFTIWETGHKYKYDELVTSGERQLHRIFLYPNDPVKKKYHTIILKIDVETNEVNTVLIKGKDGTNTLFTLSKLTKNPELSDGMFVFDCAKNPEVDCVEE